MISLLEAWGYSVSAYDTAEAALADIALLRAADCLVLDYQLPGMNGLELARVLRETSISIPVVVVSGSVSGSTVDDLKSVGVKMVLSKPVSGDTLMGHIQQLVGTE
jgi:CheY-like chemotaxis protein